MAEGISRSVSTVFLLCVRMSSLVQVTVPPEKSGLVSPTCVQYLLSSSRSSVKTRMRMGCLASMLCGSWRAVELRGCLAGVLIQCVGFYCYVIVVSGGFGAGCWHENRWWEGMGWIAKCCFSWAQAMNVTRDST
ncbi:hypothetical protein ABL78_3423 [Leptomonas seymouri]|uniref:Uncharacterized protein n=1 Tax=Leptomonas seymouri TaxID=5684 RepID=A0A0N1PCL6_LEPSE|nr:hypothetical protein ABL78_3423 [Leptomonas seymouri]|eukprot:KPI87512.1 hypothetical protein ABL78_3423 [Leptomonas seymouri]